MEIMAQQKAANRVYEDFEPYYEWNRDEGRFTVMLPGYRRDQLKVQVTSKPALKLNGERQIINNRWRRFDIEFPIPSDYDLEKVSAKFEGGRLNVKFAKQVIKPKEETTNPSQNVDKPNAAQEVTPKAKEDKVEARTNSKISDQKEKSRQSKPDTESERGNETNGITEKMEAATATKTPETKDAKPMTRFKTRLLDFTQTFRPSNQVNDEALEDLDAEPNKRKRLMNCGLLTLLVVGLGLYAKNAFTSSNGESRLHEP